MSSNPHTAYRSQDILTVVMGGGAGTRLFPLTKDRAKPAVPLAGKYRLVDIPISNCINSDLRRIFVLTQFNSSSLHRHIQETYRFDNFSPGFVEILAAQQTPLSTEWYQGTADAVRQNLVHLSNYPHRFVLILSGDQLYRMNYRAIVQRHLATEAEVTVATMPVTPAAAAAFGIMQVQRDGRIIRFVEKPKDPALVASLATDWSAFGEIPAAGADALLGSMGIYLFDRTVLEDALQGNEADFGKHLIPKLIGTRRVFAHMHQGYWEDIGTIRLVLRGQPRPLRAGAAVQLLRRHRAGVHPRALPAAHQGRALPHGAGGDRGWLHHHRRRDHPLADRRPEPHQCRAPPSAIHW